MPQVLTANRLQIGEVVYWNQALGWVPGLAEAQIFSDDEAETALKTATGSVLRGEVVAPYLFAVRLANGAVVPVKEREVIRAAGPTIRRDLGKQSA